MWYRVTVSGLVRKPVYKGMVLYTEIYDVIYVMYDGVTAQVFTVAYLMMVSCISGEYSAIYTLCRKIVMVRYRGFVVSYLWSTDHGEPYFTSCAVSETIVFIDSLDMIPNNREQECPLSAAASVTDFD